MKKTPKAKANKSKELAQVKSLSEIGGNEAEKKQAIEQFEGVFLLLAQEAINAGNARCCKACSNPLPSVRKNVCFDCFPQFLRKDDENLFC
jgi:hypothetical protein